MLMTIALLETRTPEPQKSRYLVFAQWDNTLNEDNFESPASGLQYPGLIVEAIMPANLICVP
jgi:hypothetical protein